MIDASAPRRVLMTTDTAGGVWTYTLELACSLVARGARVLLAACGPSIDLARREELSRLEGVEVAAREFRLEWMDDPWDDVDASGKWLLELEARFRPEVIHLNGFSHAALPFRAPTLVVGHSCVGSWHRAVLGHAMGDGWREYRSRVTRGLRRADLVTAPTEAMLDALRHEYGPFRAAGAIPNGRSPSAFPAAPEKKPCVAAVGRLWDAAKNLRALDLAAKDLPWPVAVAGECAHPNGSRAGFEHVEHRGVLGERDVATFLGD
ncbi:MAG TPA: glycosyltransferase, partial [Planctomycetota bacterium]|nr:glycosyltransferase [Planctomycetota bacterium]